MTNLRMTQTAAPFWNARSRFAGGLDTIMGSANGDSFVRAASRALTTVHQQMVQSGSSLLPLTAATLACAVAGPFFHAPDGIAMGAIALAAGLSSIAGFAFSAICGAMLFHLVPNTVQVVQIMILCSIANQAAMTWTLRCDIDWRAQGVFLFGGALGLPAGVWLLMHANHMIYTMVLGVFLLCYGLWMLLRRPLTIGAQHPVLDVAIGFIGGITGGAAGFPGAAITIWCGFKGWDKTRQRALFQPFILLMQVAALVAINLVRPGEAHGIGMAMGGLLCIPASLLGTAIGLTFFRGLSDTQFTRAVNLLLIVSGLSYVV